MITVKQTGDNKYEIVMDEADVAAIGKLSRAYGLHWTAMLICCVNKGIVVIGKQVEAADKPKHDDDACDDIC